MCKACVRYSLGHGTCEICVVVVCREACVEVLHMRGIRGRMSHVRMVYFLDK